MSPLRLNVLDHEVERHRLRSQLLRTGAARSPLLQLDAPAVDQDDLGGGDKIIHFQSWIAAQKYDGRPGAFAAIVKREAIPRDSSILSEQRGRQSNTERAGVPPPKS